jgi:hypothetical protein
MGGGGESMRAWKPGVTTAKGMQRQIALLLCGWNVRDDELMRTINRWVFHCFGDLMPFPYWCPRWEKDGEISRAACWLVFMKQHTKAIDLLMKSGGTFLSTQ